MNKKLISTISFFFLSIFLLLSVIDFWAFYRPFYETEYEKNDATSYTGLNKEDLLRASDTLLDYLRLKRDDIVVSGIVNGEEREIFDDREKAHMVDVRDLYQNAMTARNISGVIAGVGIVILLFTKKEKGKLFQSGFESGVSLLFVIVGMLAIYALIDFNRFWTNFHQVFFDNDLWLLDPTVSIMINMFPESFFFAMVFRIIVSFLVLLLLIYILIRIFGGRKK